MKKKIDLLLLLFAIVIFIASCKKEPKEPFIPSKQFEKTIEYGYLYNWYAVVDTNKITSSDLWRVPSKNDLDVLVNSCDGTNGGGKLKIIGNDYWDNNVGATNEYNFNAKGAGMLHWDGNFIEMGTKYGFWTTTIGTDDRPWDLLLINSSTFIDLGRTPKSFGISVRLLRDATSSELLLADGAYCDNYIGNDGTEYKTVKIGSQVWLAENLIETKYRNDEDINHLNGDIGWASITTGARCSYDNDENNAFVIE